MELEQSFKPTEKKHARDMIQVHAYNVLNELLRPFQNKKIGIKKIADKTGIHERTLHRLLHQENRPNYQTLIRLYKLYFNEYRDFELHKLLPKEIQEFVKKYFVQGPLPETDFSDQVDKKIQGNPILAEIYIMAGTGPISSDEINHRFGQYGMNLIKELILDNILKEIERNVYILGDKQANFDIPTILKSGLVMSQGHFNISNAYELDKNHIGFLAEALTEEEYHQWLSIDQDAYLKKLQIIKNKKSNGKLRAYTFMVTDVINLTENL